MNYCNTTPPKNATHTKDNHGGRAQEHREEMKQIAIEVVKEYAPKISAEIYNEALSRLIGAIRYDVESVVSVAVDGVGEIFNSSKCKKIISDHIMQEMKARLTDIKIKI